MLLLGLDFETTGLDPVNDRITEVGACLWDTERAAPVQLLQVFCNDGGVPLTEEITKLTGITQRDLDTYGGETYIAFQMFNHLAEKSDAIVAHNGNNFDKLFYEQTCRRHIVQPTKKIWIDTAQDIPYPESITTRKLKHLAVEHGFMNPFAHRALFDVVTMLRVLSHYDIHEVFKYAQAPLVTVRAMVSYDDRQKAKDRRYQWDGGKKIWTKQLRDFQLEKETKEAPFQVVVIGSSASEETTSKES